MNINSDLNILGSIADYSTIYDYWNFSRSLDTTKSVRETICPFAKIKTSKSCERYEKAIKKTLLKFQDNKIAALVNSVFEHEKMSAHSLMMLFWNASFNNDILNYLNTHVYFPALYSGRTSFKKSEVIACIRELRNHEPAILKWTESTIDITARKYMSFLSKVNCMEGKRSKTIKNQYIDDNLFILFIYFLKVIEQKPNILKSDWLCYSFMETETLIARCMQKNLRKYIAIEYTGDNLKIQPQLPYEQLYANFV